MHLEHTIVCGGLTIPAQGAGSPPIALHLGDGPAHTRVNLRIADLHQTLYLNLPAVFHDLVEIATYVYCADQAVIRSGQDTDRFGGKWRQRLHLHIPVREPAFWGRVEVQGALCGVLDFLGDHFFDFTFSKAAKPVPFQHYLELGEDVTAPGHIDQVAMFSGGLDSLAGAIDEIVTQRHGVAFVTHLPTSKNNAFLKPLRQALDLLAKTTKPMYVTVRVNKAEALGREYTQRTRSFLFAALGATVAKMLKLSSLLFYENGVVSLNLPICAQVVGGRATRTTHPRVLDGFSKLFSLVGNADFKVHNPFLWETKADVIKRIINAGAGELISSTISCAHTWERTTAHSHCGVCSQCLDRRLGIIAAHAAHLDPLTHFKTDLCTQSLARDEDRLLAATYVERAKAMKSIHTHNELIARFPEVGRALTYVESQSVDQTAQRVLDLHHRHGREVELALKTIVGDHAADLVAGTLPDDCFIKIVTNTSGSPAAAPQATSRAEPDSYFWRRDTVWEIRFQGSKRVPLHQHHTGLAYLHFLVSHQQRTFSAHQILATASPPIVLAATKNVISAEEIKSGGYAVTDGPPITDGGAMLDDKAIRNYKNQLAKLREERADAEESNDLPLQLRLDEQKHEILAALARSQGKGGRGRKMQDKAKNQRDAVRNNVNRAIEEIRQKLPALAAHFDEPGCLKLGGSNSYAPKRWVKWRLRSEPDSTAA